MACTCVYRYGSERCNSGINAVKRCIVGCKEVRKHKNRLSVEIECRGLVHGLATPPRAAVARDLCVLQWKLVVVCQLLSWDDPEEREGGGRGGSCETLLQQWCIRLQT